MITDDKLGSDQVDVINEIGKISNKPIWIKGHAGSGKSVLLLHSLADYIVRNPGSKVCVVVFTRALVDLLELGLLQIPKLNGKKIPVLTIFQLKYRIDNFNARFDAIFCDEVQDLPLDFIKSMKNSCDHLVIAGDSEQSIYNIVPVFDERPAEPEEITEGITPIEKKLTVIYRLTESILDILKKVFPVMMADLLNVAKEDTDIKLYEANDFEQEINFCWKEIKQANTMRTSGVIAILLSGHDSIIEFVNTVLEIEGKDAWVRVNARDERPDYDKMNQYLSSINIPLMYVGNSYGSLMVADRDNKVLIMTYHSSKGLDFGYVYLPMVNEDMYIHSNEDSLLLVALSRSKGGLFISYTNTLYPGLSQFLSDIEALPIPYDEDDQEIIF